MGKDKAQKKKAAKKKASVPDYYEVFPEDETDPVVIIPDDRPAPASNIVAVGQRFWLLSKGHRRKARPVQVAGVVGEGDSVTIRCLDNGERKVLPRIAFATAGSSRVLRA